MRIQDRTDIKLLNYSRSKVTVSTDRRGYLFDGAVDGVPTINFFDWKDIELINSRCHAIRTGELVFAEEDREEAYKALGYTDWRDTVIFKETIDDIVENPTMENLLKVAGIDTIDTLERVRGCVMRRVEQGLGVDVRLRDVVDARFKELRNGIRNSRITIRRAGEAAVSEEAKELRESNESLQKQIEELTAMVANLAKKEQPKKKTAPAKNKKQG